MVTSPPPEARLIEEARAQRGLSQNRAGEAAGITGNRWRQIVKGAYPTQSLRAATTVGVRAKLSARRTGGRASTRQGGSRHIDRVLAARRISRENVAG